MRITRVRTSPASHGSRLLIFAVALICCHAVTGSGQIESAIAITGVTVIDATGGAPQSLMTVIVEKGRIAAIGKSSELRPPRGSVVVDGRGRYLIPGLWDMHVHFWFAEPTLWEYVAHGVTGVRDMGSEFARTDKWRREIKEGRLVGPRIVTSGVPLDGAPSEDANIPITAVATPEQARSQVVKLKEQGVDFVKCLTGLSAETFAAVATESKGAGLPFAGHVPDSVSVVAASEAGLKSMEHLFGLSIACSARGDDLRKARNEAIAKRDNVSYARIRGEIIQTYDEARAREVFSTLVRNGTSQTPTLTQLQRMYYQYPSEPLADARLKSVPDSIRKDWKNPLDDLKGTSPATLAYLKSVFDRSLKLTGAMSRAGVEILAGTDTGDPFTYPGATLQDELVLLVRAGLSPLEALQSATRNPARFLGMETVLGTIEKGKLADMVLLSANPLDDIKNVQMIEAVIANGRLFDRKGLAELTQQSNSR